MDHSITIKGKWFLPHEKNEMLDGVLTYVPESGLQLELFGSFKSQSSNFDIILGYNLVQDGFITLVDCFEVKKSLITKIVGNYIFIGKHFNSLEEIQFSKIAYNCSNLEEWVWGSNIETREEHNPTKYITTYTPPERYGFSIDADHTLHIATKTQLPPTASIPYYEATIRETNYIEIECNGDRLESLRDLMEYKYRMDAFLTLAIGEPQNTKEIIAYYKNQKIEIYVQPYNILTPKTKLPPRMFINFHWTQSRFTAIIEAWFQKYEFLKDVLDLYFSLLQIQQPYAQHRFLFRVQVLEAYHRKTYANSSLVAENIKKKKEVIDRCVNQEDKAYLKDKLAFAHEPTLKDRLLELFRNCTVIADILEIGSDAAEKDTEINDFANKIRDARNFLTHYDKKKSKEVLGNFDLYKLSEKLDIVIRYYLFIEMGFSGEECKQMFYDIYLFSLNRQV